MKKFIYLILILIAMPTIAQEKQKTITVVGEAQKMVTGNKYALIVSLHEVMADGYQQMEPITLEQMKKTYAAKLKESNLDFSKFKRNIGYEVSAAYSDKRESAYYLFETTKAEEIRSVSQIGLNGVSVVNVEVTADKLTYEQLAELSNTAIEDATKAAKILAKKMNKKVGAIINVIDNNSKTQYVNSYATSAEQVHNVTVVFELN